MPALPTADNRAEQVLFDQAMEVQTQAAADAIFADLLVLAHRQRPQRTIAELSNVLRENLAYHAGYFGDVTRARVERLYRCAHPFFGAIAHVPPPEDDEAWQLGQMNAERHRRGEPLITLAELRAMRAGGGDVK